MSVYSFALFAISSTTSPVTVYTSPSGVATVIRELDITNATSGVDTLNIFTTGVSGFVACYITKVIASAAGTYTQWHGRFVLAPLQGVQVYSGAAGWLVHASGYQLA